MSVINEARKIIEKRGRRAELDADERKEKLEAISPELKKVNREISNAGLKVLKAISKGGNTEALIESLKQENLYLQNKQKEILRGLGVPEDILEPHYHCEICEDSGVVNGKFCDCLKKEVRRIQAKKICKSAPLENCNIDNFSL